MYNGYLFPISFNRHEHRIPLFLNVQRLLVSNKLRTELLNTNYRVVLMVSRRLLAAEVWVRSQASPYGFCDLQSDTGTGFSLLPPMSHNHLHLRHHHHHQHVSVMQLGHLLTRSGLTYPEVSSEVCHDSFCQLGNSVSLSWVVRQQQQSSSPSRGIPCSYKRGNGDRVTAV